MENLFAVFYHRSQNEPIALSVSSRENFQMCCQSLPTDWALLLDAETGDVIDFWPEKPW